jgi:hypothetical protein
MRKLLMMILIVISFLAQGQTTFKHKVFIKGKGIPKDGLKIMQDEKLLSNYEMYVIKQRNVVDTLEIEKTSSLKKTKEYNSKGVHYEIEKNINISTDSIITFNKKKEYSESFYLPKGRHKANLAVSKDSILINFWLAKNYYNLNPKEQEECPYQPDKKYFIKLKNREYVSFSFSNYEISALTIPFKYHFGFSENDIEIDPVFNADLNISTFVGTRLGKVSYTYDTYKGMVENNWCVTVGGFLGLSSQKIDSISTSLDKIPVDKEMNVPSLSYGIGAVFNISKFNLGLFLGADKGLGKTAAKWNYDNRLWFGFGFGYKLAFLGKQE